MTTPPLSPKLKKKKKKINLVNGNSNMGDFAVCNGTYVECVRTGYDRNHACTAASRVIRAKHHVTFPLIWLFSVWRIGTGVTCSPCTNSGKNTAKFHQTIFRPHTYPIKYLFKTIPKEVHFRCKILKKKTKTTRKLVLPSLFWRKNDPVDLAGQLIQSGLFLARETSTFCGLHLTDTRTKVEVSKLPPGGHLEPVVHFLACRQI